MIAVTRERVEALPGCNVPHLQGLRIAPNEPRAVRTERHAPKRLAVARMLVVRAERHASKRVAVAPKRSLFLARGHVPHFHGLIRAGGGQPAPVRAEGHAVDRTRVTSE